MHAGSGESPSSQWFEREGTTSDALYLDPGTAERLLAGTLTCDDAPPAFRGVAYAFETLRAAPSTSELAGEHAAIASIAAHLTTRTAPASNRSARRHGLAVRRLAIGTASVVAGVTLFGGLAAADALPGPAQHIASQTLHTLGVNVPDPEHQPDARPEGDSPAHDHSPPTGPPAAPNNIAAVPTTQPEALPSDPSAESQLAPPSIPTATNPTPRANGHAATGTGKSNDANGHAPTEPGNWNNGNGHPSTGPRDSNANSHAPSEPGNSNNTKS